MRSKFDSQLEELKREMTTMGMYCENAIDMASRALLNCDRQLAREIPELLNDVIQKERDVEAICLKLLLHQQPVAGDLRRVSAALKMVTDVQRIATQSTDVGEIISLGNISAVPDGLPLRDMTAAVTRMVSDSIDAFVRQDAKRAREVIEYDDVVDNLFNSTKAALIAQLKNPGVNGEMMIDLLMIAKYYERIGDHAVNVAKWVLFSLTGDLAFATACYEEGKFTSEK